MRHSLRYILLCLLVPMTLHAQTESDDTSDSSETATEASTIQSSEETAAPAPSRSNMEKIEVTGSHIRRTDVEGPSPVLVIDRQAIEKSGFNSVSQVLQRSTVSPFGASNSSTNGSTVSLKGLGSGRTLVLVNGHRAPGSGSSYASGAVDVNFVPLAAVERIEVLKDGASATYGSDALGGVINIITKKDLDGFSFSNQYNMTQDNGSDMNRLALAYGTQSSKSNFLTSMQFVYAQGNRTSDLDFARDLNKSFPFSSNYIDDDGKIAPSPLCNQLNSLGRCEELISPRQVNKPGYGLDSVTQYNRDIGDMTLYSTLMVGWDRDESEFPNALNTPGQSLGVGFSAAEAPAAWSANLPNYSGGNTRVFHRFDDFINRERENDYYAALILGTRGFWGDSNWEWDVSMNNQIRIEEQKDYNLGTLSGTKAAIVNGTYDPFDANVRDTTGLGVDATTRNRASVNWLEMKTNGELGSALGFDWASAFGTSIAHFAYSDSRAAVYTTGNSMPSSGVVGRGARELYSVFTEFSGMIGNSFELQFSVRGDFYSDFGETFNPKLAARYQPAKWLTFRSSVGTGFQAPTLQDMNAKIEGYDFLVDQKLCKDPAFGNNDISSPYCQTQSRSVYQDNNANLKEETSISMNFGAIVQPTKNFSVGIDWWYVKVEDTIGSNLDDIMQIEQQGGDPTQYGVNIIRAGGSPTGEIQRIEFQLYNVGKEEANGIDLDINYKMPTTIGDFRFQNETTYLNHYYEEFYQEFGKQQVLGQFGKPRWRNNFTVGYSVGIWDFQAVARSIADVEKNVRGIGKTVSPTQYDLAITYDPSWAGEFQLGAINIGNIKPRFDPSIGARINTSMFAFRETYYLTYRQDF